VADIFLGAFVFAGFRSEHHGGGGDDGHEGLQQEQGSVLGSSSEGAVAMNGAPGRKNSENADGSGGFAAAETERGPNQKWEAEIFERIVFHQGAESIAENEPGDSDEAEKETGEFDNLGAVPVDSRVFNPNENERSDEESADAVAQPPGKPEGREMG